MRSLVERFEEKVHHEPMSGCWLWGGCSDSGGYGQIRASSPSKVVQATKVALELYCDVIVPAGMVVCHRCDNPPCVNPDHLFVGTIADNNADKARKGRAKSPTGSKHYGAKITENDVSAIRRAYANGATLRELAQRYGLTPAGVGHAAVGRGWKHVVDVPPHRKTTRKRSHDR